jgi:hypothetical protein
MILRFAGLTGCDVGDNENGPKDNNIGLPIDSHLVNPFIPREKEK